MDSYYPNALNSTESIVNSENLSSDLSAIERTCSNDEILQLEDQTIMTTKNEQDPPPERTYRRCTFACDHQGTYEPKKTVILENQRNSKSKKSGCLWDVNVSFPKKTVGISVTSLELNHNHTIIEGNLNATIQCRLLSAKFPNFTIHPRNLQNLIQKYKRMDREENDAAKLLKHLLTKKAEEPGWEVYWELHQETNNFYICQNALSPADFESQWYKLIAKYPKAVDYLNFELYPSKERCVQLSGASAECFPQIDRVLEEYLTEEMLHDRGTKLLIRTAVESGSDSLYRLKRSLNNWFAEEKRLSYVRDDDQENFDPSQVENLIKKQHRGRPSTKRLKSSIELPQTKIKTSSNKPAKNKCGRCGTVGHYAPTCNK
ncbi:5637_t:CDS:2 [Gigaspora margarita]|uniref:5637_t:CDS:1 n=1 Tax=Gigaspora margarita TaxID=4874 RepID=A0ABN7VFY9_GIGMA|nr:5637_t:CDS:2 [Gigaspora margarita]